MMMQCVLPPHAMTAPWPGTDSHATEKKVCEEVAREVWESGEGEQRERVKVGAGNRWWCTHLADAGVFLGGLTERTVGHTHMRSTRRGHQHTH